MRLLLIMASILPMFGTAIIPDGSYHEFSFNLATSAVVSCGGAGCVPTINPVAEETSSPPWTFTTIVPTTLFVLDLFNKGDRFQFFDNAVSVSSTTVVANTGVDTCSNNIACAIADVGYSRLSVVLPAGAHSLTGNVITNAAGTSGGAAVFRSQQFQSPVRLHCSDWAACCLPDRESSAAYLELSVLDR